MTESLIELVDVSRTYALGGGVTVLRDVNLRVSAGEYVGILGPSGSGKSTMLHLLGLLDRPSAGQVLFRDQDINELTDRDLSGLRGRAIGFVFQAFHLIGQLTVLENVELPLFYQRVPRHERRKRALKALSDVGLGHRLDHTPLQLSGGECQRTAIARALVTDPDMLLADEPTGNLDSKTGADVLALLAELHERGRTVVMITHDPAIADVVPRVVRLHDGRIVEGAGATA